MGPAIPSDEELREGFFKEMEVRIMTYLKNNNAEPGTLEQMEHRKLMNQRKGFTLKLNTRI
jgi:hypothetical protein